MDNIDLTEQTSMYNFKKRLKERKVITILVIVVLILISAGVFAATQNNSIEGSLAEVVKQVQVEKVSDLKSMNLLESVGEVKAETKVDLVAMTNATVETINFDIGDQVQAGQLLVSMYDAATLTSLSNSMTSYYNSQNSYNTVKALTNESIENSKLALEQAKLGLKTAQDNYDNSLNLQAKNNLDTKETAVISFNNFENQIFTVLDSVNYILKAEGSSQVPGIGPVLSVKNPQYLNNAKPLYQELKRNYDVLVTLDINTDNVELNMEKMVKDLNLTERLVSETINVLNSTVAYADFPETSLNTYKTAMINLKTGVVANYNQAQTLLNTLKNLEYYNKKETDALANNLAIAQKQVEMAEAGVTSSQKSQEQQLNGAQSALDGSQGQMYLSQTQSSKLNIFAPISGTITNKNIELGNQINPGQKIGEISQTNLVKIEIFLPSEDAYKVEVGKNVFINNDLIGVVSSVAPSADAITKKIKVEIIFDNSNQDLIIGSFVDVMIVIEQPENVEQTYTIPLKNVTIGQNETYVFVYENGLAKKRIVELGKVKGVNVEVLNGLSESDMLIIDGNKLLKDNEAVELIEQ